MPTVLTPTVLAPVAMGPRALVPAGGPHGTASTLTLSPVAWLTGHRERLEGLYGSTAYGWLLLVGADHYLWASHDTGDELQVGRDPAPPGRTGHEVQLPAGNRTAVQFAAAVAPVLAAVPGVVSVDDNEDGTLVVVGPELELGGSWDDRAGGGLAGFVGADADPTVETANGGIAQTYISRMEIAGPWRLRCLRIWVHSVDLADAPRVRIWRGDETAPTTLVHDFGQLPVATIDAPGWCTLWVESDDPGSFEAGEVLWFSVSSVLNTTLLTWASNAQSPHTWEGGVVGSSYEPDATEPGSPTWDGEPQGPAYPTLVPCVQLVWEDPTTTAGDGSFTRPWGSPRSTPIGDYGSQTPVPNAIVHMVAPTPPGFWVLGEAHLGIGTQTNTQTIRVCAWAGTTAQIDPTEPYPAHSSDGLVLVHTYGRETTIAPESYHDWPAPEQAIVLTAGHALALSVHSAGDGVGVFRSRVRFDQTGAGAGAFANTLRHRGRAYDWAPMSGDAPVGGDTGQGSEVEAHHPSAAPWGDGNATIVTDAALDPSTPHEQDPDDVHPGNIPAIGCVLRHRGCSIT